MEIIDSRSTTYFEQINAFFDPQLHPLELGKEQIEQQSLAELEQSLDSVIEAIKNADLFGIVKINSSAEGEMYIAKSTSESIVEVSILPILLERKKLILQRIKTLQGNVQRKLAERLTNIFRLLTAISLNLSLICIFEFCIYLLPWHWLIEHPNSYGLQASFDIFIILLIVGILYPMWRKWCWGVGAFAVLLVVVQILGGPSK